MKKHGSGCRARRQRIPAFGEWNYDHHHHHGYGGDWPVTQYFDSALVMHGDGGMQQQQRRVVMAPGGTPSHDNPVKKIVTWSDNSGTVLEAAEEKQRKDHGAAMKKQGKQSRVADAADYYGYNNGKPSRVVVKPVDQDLYHIPPDMLCHKPNRKRLTRASVWMGCLGLACCDA